MNSALICTTVFILSTMGMAVLVTYYMHKNNKAKDSYTYNNMIVAIDYEDAVSVCIAIIVLGVLGPVGWCVLLTYIWLFEKGIKDDE